MAADGPTWATRGPKLAARGLWVLLGMMWTVEGATGWQVPFPGGPGRVVFRILLVVVGLAQLYGGITGKAIKSRPSG